VQFAELGGVKRVSQHLYEQDVRLPDLGYIFHLGESGVDVAFLVMGTQADSHRKGAPVSLKAALAAFRAVRDIEADRSAPSSAEEQERLFTSLCQSLTRDKSTPADVSTTTQPRRGRSATR
jgi:hypothetical protein